MRTIKDVYAGAEDAFIGRVSTAPALSIAVQRILLDGVDTLTEWDYIEIGNALDHEGYLGKVARDNLAREAFRSRLGIPDGVTTTHETGTIRGDTIHLEASTLDRWRNVARHEGHLSHHDPTPVRPESKCIVLPVDDVPQHAHEYREGVLGAFGIHSDSAQATADREALQQTEQGRQILDNVRQRTGTRCKCPGGCGHSPAQTEPDRCGLHSRTIDRLAERADRAEREREAMRRREAVLEQRVSALETENRHLERENALLSTGAAVRQALHQLARAAEIHLDTNTVGTREGLRGTIAAIRMNLGDHIGRPRA